MRYFLIFYQGEYKSGKMAPQLVKSNGSMGWSSIYFPSKLQIERELKKSRGYDWVSITSVSEVAEDDFKSYFRK